MSLCDSCYAPGKCCKSLSLSGGPITEDRRALESGRPSWSDAFNFARKNDLPFIPEKAVLGDDGLWFWRFSCPKLSPTGRCTIYEDRPQLCREYPAGYDDLCVHSRGTTSGDASAGVYPHNSGVGSQRGYREAVEIIDNEAPYEAAA